ncbi:MAG: cyclic nucleotide-binding domain-containing protein [Proteobacteria bacterium]|nr:cyclic nucleotide-binding domain-containing protein [Pseudomonadota bacterium]
MSRPQREIATIVFLLLISTSFNLSALEASTRTTLPMATELRGHGLANIASGSIGGLPGLTDIVGSIMYSRLGVTSRSFMLIVGAVCVAVAVVGGGFIEFIPKIVLGALIFVTAIQFLRDWLFTARRSMTRIEGLAVWSIFVVIVTAGFIPGIVLGIILSSLLFIVRYSRTSVVESTFSLDQQGSSVDRSVHEAIFLREFGQHVRIFNLRGFLFFGSASLFFESLKRDTESEPPYSVVVFNFRRVTGIDSTAVQIFFKILNMFDSAGTRTLFCALTPAVHSVFAQAEGFDDDRFVIVDDLDLALKWAEEDILSRQLEGSGRKPVLDIMSEIVGDREKANRLVAVMTRMDVPAGDYLFHQGDSDTSLFIIESGVIEVRLESPDGRISRLREFRHGTVVGEMAAYSDSPMRSASACAVKASVVYRLDPESITDLGEDARDCQLALHEFVARLLAVRLSFMNRRLEVDV